MTDKQTVGNEGNNEKAAQIEDLITLEQNPFSQANRGPEEIVRLFYQNDLPVLPVVSRRGILLGILTKDSVVAELSDLERSNRQTIDAFITKLARKISLDELLPLAGNIKEFLVINLFGEIFGRWSRLQLFSACENIKDKKAIEAEISKQKNDQAMEWLIYLVLENIPRALYAVNENGRTIFFNSLFEDIYIKAKGGNEVDVKFVEESLKDPDKNAFHYKGNNDREIYFFNEEMNFYYEKVPLSDNDKIAGYLIFCDKSLNVSENNDLSGIDTEGLSLKEVMESAERTLIVNTIKKCEYKLDRVSEKLKVPGRTLAAKIEKLGIDIKKK